MYNYDVICEMFQNPYFELFVEKIVFIGDEIPSADAEWETFSNQTSKY